MLRFYVIQTEANKKLCVERRGSSPTIALKSQHDLGHAILDSAKTVLTRSGKFPLGHLILYKADFIQNC